MKKTTHLPQPFQKSKRPQPTPTGPSGKRRNKSENGRTKDAGGENAFATENARQKTARNLREDVAVEERGQEGSLHARVPGEFGRGQQTSTGRTDDVGVIVAAGVVADVAVVAYASRAVACCLFPLRVSMNHIHDGE